MKHGAIAWTNRGCKV